MTDIEFKQLTNLMTSLAAGVNRIADAMEAHQAQDADEDQTIVMTLSDYKAFDWSTIGSRVIFTDADGVAAVQGADGKIYNRRNKADFGNDIWFARGAGKDKDGKAKYKALIRFVEFKADNIKLLDRQVLAAVGKAVPAQAQQRPVDAPKASPATVTPPAPEKAPVSAKYAPSAEERRTVSALLDYAGLTAKADKNEIIRNAETIRAKFAAACAEATKRGMTCSEKPENLKQAIECTGAMALACVEFDQAQPEMALN